MQIYTNLLQNFTVQNSTDDLIINMINVKKKKEIKERHVNSLCIELPVVYIQGD